MNETMVSASPTFGSAFSLSPQQIKFFRTFGFLKLTALFKDDIKRLTEGFEEVFNSQEPDHVLTEDPLQETDNPTFQNRRRLIMVRILERSDKLRWLMTDPRILNVVTSLVGERYEAKPTDGHIFHCDTSWHPDKTTDAGFRVKLSFYLDPQRADSGAIRLIPGSQDHESTFGKELLTHLYGSPKKTLELFGVDASEIPCCTVETDPGDVICWDVRAFHATFHGFERRRLFSMTYCAVP